jgi:hypothetical protein
LRLRFGTIYLPKTCRRRKWLRNCFVKRLRRADHEIYISEVVNIEIDNAPDGKKEKMFDAIQKYAPDVLPRDSEVNLMADAYIENGLLTEKHFRDVLHLSIASTNRLDILLSWNMRHIVRRKTQLIVNMTNREHGCPVIEIWTPKEMMDYAD